MLCMECGNVFNLTNTMHEEMLAASILSFDKGDNTGLERIFAEAVVPMKEYKGLNKKLESELLILSSYKPEREVPI